MQSFITTFHIFCDLKIRKMFMKAVQQALAYNSRNAEEEDC